MKSRGRSFLLILLSAGTLWAGMEGYRFVARMLAAAATMKSRKRVAVMPLASETGKRTRSSAIVTERLTSEISAADGVEVIERSRLDQLLKEQSLQARGAVDPATVRKIGALLGADAVVTGSVIELDGNTVEVNARLVDAQNGKILKAVNKKMSKDWQDDRSAAWKDFDININMDVAFDAAPEPLLPAGFMNASCGHFSAEDAGAARMGAELQARFVAHGLKTGKLKIRDLTSNPGSEIKDTELRRFFHSKIKEWYYSPDAATPLTSGEEETMERLKPLVASYPCR